ncbi:MAG: hypothetical protein VYB54_00215 [Pseudomonadota bacterium]|nr:hypothetical protein [Pseudomonadota bacterium]
MTFTPHRNPDDATVRRLIASSSFRAARRIVDLTSGDRWYWPAEQATHAEGARMLGIDYHLPPGAGDIVTDD